MQLDLSRALEALAQHLYATEHTSARWIPWDGNNSAVRETYRRRAHRYLAAAGLLTESQSGEGGTE